MLQKDMTLKSNKVATYLEKMSAYFVHPAVQQRLDCLLLMPWLLQNELNLDQGCQEPVPGMLYCGWMRDDVDRETPRFPTTMNFLM